MGEKRESACDCAKMQTNAYATPKRSKMRLSTFAKRKTAGGSNRH